MKICKFALEFIALLIFCSLIPLWNIFPLSNATKIALTILFSIVYLFIIFRKGKEKSNNKKLRRLNRGICIVQFSAFAIVAEIIILALFFVKKLHSGIINAVFAVVMPIIAIGILMFAGIIRIALNSRQIRIKDHVLMICFWWFPIVNLLVVRRFYKTARCEYIVERDRIELENARAELQTPFAREAELAEKTKRLKELNILLNMDEKDKTLMDDGPDEGEEMPERKVVGLER